MARRRLRRQRGRGRRLRRQRGRGFKDNLKKLGQKLKSAFSRGLSRFRKSNTGRQVISTVVDKAVDYGLRRGNVNNPMLRHVLAPRAKQMVARALTS